MNSACMSEGFAEWFEDAMSLLFMIVGEVKVGAFTILLPLRSALA